MRATRALCKWQRSSFSRILGPGQSRSAEAKAFRGSFEKGAVTFTSDCFCSFSLASICFALQSAAPQSSRPKPQLNSANTEGQKIFASTCAGCHGLDGRGGERAPNIAQNREVQRLSDAELTRIVQEGVPGTGMPAFHSLASSDVKAVVAYLRTLQGTNKTSALPGNPVRGKAVVLRRCRLFRLPHGCGQRWIYCFRFVRLRRLPIRSRRFEARSPSPASFGSAGPKRGGRRSHGSTIYGQDTQRR